MVSKVVDPDSSIDKRWKGVRKRAWGRWVCEIRLPRSRERIWLGSYATAEEAAYAYDAASLCLRGKSASLNFPCSASISSLLSRDSSSHDPMPPPLTREAIQSIAAAAAAKCRNSQADDAGERNYDLSACNEAGQQRAGSNTAGDVLPHLRRPSDWAAAMAMQLRLIKMKGRRPWMHGGDESRRRLQMDKVADAPQASSTGSGESSSGAEDDQCLFSILKEFEPLPSICNSHGTPLC